MFIKSHIRTAFLCLVLLGGIITGVPMRPQDVEEMTRRGRHAKSEQVLEDDNDTGEGRKGNGK